MASNPFVQELDEMPPSEARAASLSVSSLSRVGPVARRGLAVLALATVAVALPARAEGVSAGHNHTCVFTAAGAVKCWGLNTDGQLGDNSTTKRLTPVGVTGLTSGVAAISAGHSHTCALTTAGGVKCWGSNSGGQLGDNSTTTRLTPVDVAGLTSGVAAISAGDNHTCARTIAGGVKCWGGNTFGALGDNSTTQRLTPVDVTGLTSGVAAISAGSYQTCALTTAGGVKCWGMYVIDDFTSGTRKTPLDVAGLASGVAAISAGNDYGCALTTAGGVKCWGRNRSGQLGDNSTSLRLAPVDVVGLASGVAAISAFGGHTCALTTVGGVKCWGSNAEGRLGDNSTTDRLAPVDVTGLTSGAAAVSAGGSHTCALTTAGAVKCWGSNRDGQRGDYSATEHLTPVNVRGLASGVAAISAGDAHTCALTTAGGVKCWGLNPDGQIGDGSTADRLTPVDVTGLASGVAAISADKHHTCALTTTGGVKCWGLNATGQLGDGSTTQHLAPTDVTGLTSGAAAISAGGDHTCALTTAGGAKCWGANFGGQIGDNTTTRRLTPVDVAGLTSGVAAISLGSAYTCAVTTAGGAKCWGFNNSGQVGDNSTTDRLAPVDVTGLTSGVAAISVGAFHACVRTTSGGAKCWGGFNTGQIGDNTRVQRLAPVDVTGLTSGVAAIAGGFGHTCAITTSGGAKCWGGNFNGEVGDNTRTQRLAPVDVAGLTSGAAAISPGTSHTCALTTAGGVKCWGWNMDGRLGDGAVAVTLIPATVVDENYVPLVVGAASVLAASPASLDFGGQSMNTTAPALAVTLTNGGTGTVTISAVTASTHFAVTHNCATLAPGASCAASVGFTPMVQGSLGGTLGIAVGGGTLTVPLSGTGERSLVTHYYRSILRRAPDAGGKTFWDAEAARVQALGVNVNEVWFALAGSFYGSAEYAAQGRDNAGYVTDMYNTFFNRAPDAAGLTYWAGLLASGMPREVVLASFMFSSEFTTFTQAIFGAAATRKEVDTVVDFYRGILGRLPDDGGFGYWLQLFRQAQCQGAGAVSAQAESISSQYANSPEYGARNRSNAQFVGDMYNAFLRRGGDLAGVQYWLGQLDSGARSRQDVRQNFVASAEFSSRVASVIAQGCLP